jgi:hypothetical protein
LIAGDMRWSWVRGAWGASPVDVPSWMCSTAARFKALVR